MRGFRRRPVDPGGGGFGEGHGCLVHEPRGVLRERAVKCDPPGRVNSIHLPEMHLIRRHQTDPGMVVILVVPIEESAAEVPGVLNAREPLRKPWLVFQVFEMALGERVVVGRMRPVVRTGDSKIGQQKRGCFGLHWGAAIGVQRELTAWHFMFGDGVLEKRPKQRGAFGICDVPANHPAPENIQDHVEIELGPLRRTHQFGDVPRPDLVGHFGQQFWFLVDGMTQLPTPFANFAMLAQQAIHRADRAMIDAVIQ